MCHFISMKLSQVARNARAMYCDFGLHNIAMATWEIVIGFEGTDPSTIGFQIALLSSTSNIEKVDLKCTVCIFQAAIWGHLHDAPLKTSSRLQEASQGRRTLTRFPHRKDRLSVVEWKKVCSQLVSEGAFLEIYQSLLKTKTHDQLTCFSENISNKLRRGCRVCLSANMIGHNQEDCFLSQFFDW